MKCISCILSFWLIVTLSSVAKADDETDKLSSLTAIDNTCLWSSPEESIYYANNEYIKKISSSNVDAKFVRFHFNSFKNIDNNWSIIILDNNGSKTNYDKSDLVNIDGNYEIWTSRVTGHEGNIQIKIDPMFISEPMTFTVSSCSYESLEVESLSYFSDPPDLLDITDEIIPKPIKLIANSIILITFVTENGIDKSCTGFLIAKSHIITNEHCVRSPFFMSTAKIDFRHQTNNSETQITDILKVYEPNKDLDYAILKIKDDFNNSPLILANINEYKELIGVLSKPYLLQHPGGDVKQIAINKCEILGEPVKGVTIIDSDIPHVCDAIGGSSGSPLLIGGEVVALHHWGKSKKTNYKYNSAVRIDKIIQSIRKDFSNIHDNIKTN